MRVKCMALLPNDEQAELLGIGKHYFPGQMEFDIKIGREYVVFALSLLNGALWVDILSQTETHVYSVPFCLFEIIDGMVSKYWVAKVDENGYFFLWPPSFYKPYYHDDLTEGIPEVVEDFNKVRQLILEEFSTD